MQPLKNTLPPTLPTSAQKAAQNYEERQAAADAAQSTRYELERDGRRQAEAADRASAVKAVESGKDIPAPTAVPAYEKELQEAIRQEGILKEVAQRSRISLDADLIVAQPDWLTDAEKQVATATKKMRADIEKLEKSYADLRKAIAIRTYVQGLGSSSPRPFAEGAELLTQMKSSGGSPIHAHKLIAELKGTADLVENPPLPKRPTGTLPPGAQIEDTRALAPQTSAK